MKLSRGLIYGMGLFLVGCAKESSLPEQPIDDPAARTTTAFNSPGTPQAMATKCDVPIYPGADAPDGLSHMPKLDPDGNTHYELVLSTQDAPQKVADYYSKSLHIPALKSKNSLSLVGKSPKKNDLIIEVVTEAGHTLVRIHSIAYKNS